MTLLNSANWSESGALRTSHSIPSLGFKASDLIVFPLFTFCPPYLSYPASPLLLFFVFLVQEIFLSRPSAHYVHVCTQTHTNSGVHVDVHSQKHKHKPLSLRHQAVIEAPGSPTHTCISAIFHPKSMHSEMYPTTHIGLFTPKDTQTQICIHSTCQAWLSQFMLPPNLPELARELPYFIPVGNSVYICVMSAQHVWGWNSCTTGWMKTTPGRSLSSESSQRTWRRRRSRDPSEGCGPLVGIRTCPSPVLCKPAEDPEAGSRSQWVTPKGRGLQNRKGRSYWGL